MWKRNGSRTTDDRPREDERRMTTDDESYDHSYVAPYASMVILI